MHFGERPSTAIKKNKEKWGKNTHTHTHTRSERGVYFSRAFRSIKIKQANVILVFSGRMGPCVERAARAGRVGPKWRTQEGTTVHGGRCKWAPPVKRSRVSGIRIRFEFEHGSTYRPCHSQTPRSPVASRLSYYKTEFWSNAVCSRTPDAEVITLFLFLLFRLVPVNLCGTFVVFNKVVQNDV